MVETLILGILLGSFVTCIGAAYSAYRYLKKPYMIKALSDGYEVVTIDRKFDNGDHGYVALRKDDKIISAIRFDKDGITDVIHGIL